MEKYREQVSSILKIATNRLVLLCALALVGFIVMVSVLFDRQIVQANYHVPRVNTSERTIPINAPRGQIFDVNGRPLAISLPVFTVMMDPSLIFDVTFGVAGRDFDLNTAFLQFISIMEHNQQEISIDSEFFISQTTPRIFTTSEGAASRWLLNLNLDGDLTATQAYQALIEYFQIPQGLDRDVEFMLIELRVALYLQRFNIAQVQLAMDIDRQTIAALQESSHALPGIYIATDYLRYYPQGRYTTNVIGYIARINERDLAENAHLGYLPTDLFGLTGVERAFEQYLVGTRGQYIIEVDNNGRRVGIIEHIPPVPGDDIFLTIDSVLQREIYYHLQDTLSRLLLNRLRSQGTVFAREILASTVAAGNVSSLLIMNAEQDDEPASFAMQSFILQNSDINPNAGNFRAELNEFISNNIRNGRISMNSVFNVMEEQGIITITDSERGRLASGALPASVFIVHLVETRQLTPQMINIQPYTASAAITCIHTGAVIAAVNYPTFDANNFLPHRLDNAYITRQNTDPTLPQNPRVFSEAVAPGSTFKMVTALAGLSHGIITPDTIIPTQTIFRDAGPPYLRCWIHGIGHHGSINVETAIAVSSNYFFNRIAFNMGNPSNGRTLESIAVLNYYMMALGLGSPTGIEIGEAPTTVGRENVPRIASPAMHQALGRPGNWTAGMTSNVSIGQGDNAYTALSMAKVMATLASGGTRMQMHLMDHRVEAGGTAHYFQPVIEYNLDIDPANVAAIHNGMLGVTTYRRGTGRGIFNAFPIPVAVKSGTAEVAVGLSHSSYGGFAPFDDPRIAIYVVIPHGDSSFLSGSAGHATRAILEEYFGLNQRTNPQSSTTPIQ
ncbi:MAG: penicillin-binding transpeptidase domain-containing protein [Defluviitaleaceae bacterium]|nr:penicillin-binding transpeptidase domain-containing protein [Defluviitaleaceae bacterium]